MKEDFRLYLRLLSYVRSYWHRFAVAVLAMLGVSGITALLAYLVKPVLDDVFFGKNLTMLYVLPPLVVLLYAVKGALTFTHNYQMSYIGVSTTTRLRDELFQHLQRQPHAFFDRQSTGALMSRMNYDVFLLQDAVARVVTSLVKDTFTVVGLIGVIFYREWRLAILATMVLPLTALIIVRIGRRLRRLSTATQESMAELNTLQQESFTGHRIIKAFVREDFEKNRFEKLNRKLFRLRLKQTVTRNLSNPLMDLLGAVAMAAIIFYGGYNVIRGTSTPGTFFSFLAALLMLYTPLKALSGVHNSIQEGLAAAQRIFALLDLDPAIKDRPGARELPPLSREIVYDRVTFAYDDCPVLEDVSLTVRKGEIVALVGPSGAGKTTLLSLLPRFYEVSRGAIRIDGVDIRDVTLASLRSQIGVVTQQTILFNNTVRFNVAYGRPEASESEIIAALKAANAFDFVMALPQTLDTVVGEKGVRLSGGEQQRLAIARALLKDPPILILDEATSSLDSEAERVVQQALDRLMAGRTTLVIAHRLSTVRNAHRIVVMDKGRIVETGTHRELLKKGGLYTRLYEMQFAREEEASRREPMARAVN